MYVKCSAPGLVHDDTVTTQASFGILLGELSPEGVSSSIDGHFFIILPHLSCANCLFTPVGLAASLSPGFPGRQGQQLPSLNLQSAYNNAQHIVTAQ